MHEILSQIRELDTWFFLITLTIHSKSLKVLKSRPFMKSFEAQKSYDWMTFSIILYDYILSKKGINLGGVFIAATTTIEAEIR